MKTVRKFYSKKILGLNLKKSYHLITGQFLFNGRTMKSKRKALINSVSSLVESAWKIVDIMHLLKIFVIFVNVKYIK
jgi:hypothetical protein